MTVSERILDKNLKTDNFTILLLEIAPICGKFQISELHLYSGYVSFWKKNHFYPEWMDLLIYMSSVRRKYFHIQDKTTGCRNKDTLISLCRVRWPSCPTTAAEEVSLRSSFASKVARMSPGRKAQDRSGAPLDEGREKLVFRELEHQPMESNKASFSFNRVLIEWMTNQIKIYVMAYEQASVRSKGRKHGECEKNVCESSVASFASYGERDVTIYDTILNVYKKWQPASRLITIPR